MKLSVVIPVYKPSSNFKEAILSLQNQLFKEELEVVVVMDPSGLNDDISFVKSILKDDSRFSLILNGTREGVSKSRYIGFLATSGQYVYFMDGDDILLPGSLNKMTSVLEKSGADCLNFSFYLLRNGKKVSFPLTREGRFTGYRPFDLLLSDGSIRSFLWSKCFRRELILKNDFLFLPPGENLIGEDFLFLVPLFLSPLTLYSIKDPLYIYRDDGGLSKTNHLNRAFDHLRIFELSRHYLDLRGDQEAIKIFISKSFRIRLTLSFDLSLEKKESRPDFVSYSKQILSEFELLKKSEPLPLEGLAYSDIVGSVLDS